MRLHVKSTGGKLLVEGLIAAGALVLAYQFRYDGTLPAHDRLQMWMLALPVAFGRIATSALLKGPRRKWRYLSTPDVLHLTATWGVFSAVLLLLRFIRAAGSWLHIPLGVIAADMVLGVIGSAAVRLCWRVYCERQQISRGFVVPRRVLLIGAGFHGATVAREAIQHKAIKLVGFLDDDPQMHGCVVAGARVLGSTTELATIIKKEEVDDVLICSPRANRSHIVSEPAEVNARVRFVPTLDEVLQSDQATPGSSGDASSRRIRLINGSARFTTSPAPSSIRNKRIVITGGAGFIGSSLALRLASANELVLFDLTFARKPIQFTSLPHQPSIKLVEGNILDASILATICQDADIVIHAAALLGVNRVCNAARDTLETNYVGTSRLLTALKQNKRLRRFIYFSTSEVFGVNSYRVTEEAPTVVGPAAEARWSYAIAKLAGEHLVKSYYRDTGMPVVIVRPFNVFGPLRSADYALFRFIMSALAGTPLEVHGDGSQVRSWCYIEDFCDAIVSMIERCEAVGEDFNIGNSSNTVTIHELARKVVELANSTSPIVFIEHPHPDISIRVPCLAKAKKLLGYNPHIDLNMGLSATLEWHRSNHGDLLAMTRNLNRSETEARAAATS